jgi:hypothetical protein
VLQPDACNAAKGSLFDHLVGTASSLSELVSPSGDGAFINGSCQASPVGTNDSLLWGARSMDYTLWDYEALLW